MQLYFSALTANLAFAEFRLTNQHCIVGREEKGKEELLKANEQRERELIWKV